MNKKELIGYISKSTDLSTPQAEKALNGFLGAITKSLRKKEKVSLVGFGTFSTSKREARTGRNPQTGQSIKIPSKTVVKFKAGKAIGDEVNNR